MGEIIQEEKGKKGGKRRPKKHSTHIDMTPMVDLMCLLITFFMLTTAFSKSKVMEIVLPDKLKVPDNVNQNKIPESRTLSIILGENNVVYYYPGKVDKAPYPPLQVTDFSAEGIRKVLLDRNKALFTKIDQLQKDVITGKSEITRDSLQSAIRDMKISDDKGPIILIKAEDKAKYRNMVDIIDEMALTNIARYAFVELNFAEKIMLNDAKGVPQANQPK